MEESNIQPVSSPVVICGVSYEYVFICVYVCMCMYMYVYIYADEYWQEEKCEIVNENNNINK